MFILCECIFIQVTDRTRLSNAQHLLERTRPWAVFLVTGTNGQPIRGFGPLLLYVHTHNFRRLFSFGYTKTQVTKP
ncbi:hypothetical protein HanXRQr2_Chr13g0607811 [Helianthus annuus]|uniref:Uncharacterized protein n=1 Tax=Helianthus annuus TaxID=4232 RepID=A0A9K3HDI2_HELAN|nr:hypothetical protein HanXRQr2_Chr13g0607811 [Helianthus annuus]KAJ0850887.1 hypothetical protein HanPSC8_Chr13g0586031 [Helianthus annuus]